MNKILPYLIGGLVITIAFYTGYRVAPKTPALNLDEVVQKQQIVLDSLAELQKDMQVMKGFISTSLTEFEVQVKKRDKLLEEREKRLIQQRKQSDDLRALLKKTDKTLDEIKEIGRRMPF